MCVSARALDGVYGRPAAGVHARLERLQDGGWELVGHGETGADGQITAWVGKAFTRGAHRIVFETDQYFAELGMAAAYPEIAVGFRIQDEADTCQIQLVLAPSSYSMHFATHG